MKKLLAMLLTLSLLLCTPAMAELGSADVTMNGNQYHISLESVEIKDGKLYVATSGMAQTMAFGPEGIQLAADIVPVYGEERLHASDKDILFGADVTYRFDRDTLPDAILMIPTQDAENPVTLWENTDEEPSIPDELVGEWRGTGAPKGGGPSIDLTATINADGTGEYTFIQDDYTESYPFTVSSGGSAFSVDIPADNTLGISACGGTWALEDGVLKLDITTTFASGGRFSYTAECEKVGTGTPDSEPVDVPTSIATGDTVTFGRYEQDGDDANGPEPIEWIVLENDGETAKLISRYALDCKPYNDSHIGVTWETCTLRQWLNSEFIDAAFSSAEQAKLMTTTVKAEKNPSYDTNPGNDTQDRVFLLSVNEAERYFASDSARQAQPTTHAVNQGGYVDGGNCYWWLRSPGSSSNYAARVLAVGSFGNDDVSLDYYLVRPVIRLDLARAFSHAEPGDPVRLGGTDYELLLFTMAQDNWDLVSASARDPLPAQGEVYLLRLAVAEGGVAVTPDTIKETIAPAMGLYAEDEGVASELFRIVTPDDGETRVFDILFYCENFHALEELSLLCDGVLYPLDGLPRDGEKLALPTPEELAIEALNALHARAKNEAGDAIENAACTGDVIVAWYTDSNDGASPRVITAGSINEWDFPMEYRAESFETARWAAIIHPTYRQVGWYSGLAGGAASETTTWLSLFDLETDKLYEVKVATEDPPQTITVQTINGIPLHSGASGDFRGDDALARLTQLIEAAHTAPTPTPTPEPTPTPTPEPTPEPTAEPTEDLPDVKSLLDAGAQDAAKKLQMGSTGLNQQIGAGVNAAENAAPKEDGTSDADMTDTILDALNNDTYRAAYDALRSGEVVQKGSKGDIARGVQQTLAAFGQSIAVDGSVGSKTIAALNAVQAAFGLPETESLDADGYAQLLPGLLMVTNPDEADALLAGRMDAGEYDYLRGCALVAQGKYASAKALFEESGFGDWEARAGACVLPWPKTGVLYKNPSVKGSSTELAVQFNTDADTAMLVKIYTADGVLARTMFIGGTGKAKTSLPAGTYVIKDGTGHDWYGEEEAFGSEGYYEIMTFGDGRQEVQLKKNYSSTITVNVQENNPDAEGVGSDWESWDNF